MVKTTTIKKDEIQRDWHLVDASGIRLGKLATAIAKILQGKNKARFCRHLDCGDHVVVINSKNIDFHPTRLRNKIYWRHSGHPKGLKRMSLEEMLKNKPNEVIKKAVWGMMPKNKLGRSMIKKLHVFEEENHLYDAQKPKLMEITH